MRSSNGLRATRSFAAVSVLALWLTLRRLCPNVSALSVPPFNVVELYVDAACSQPLSSAVAAAQPFAASLTFQQWGQLPSAAVLTSLSAAAAAAPPCVHSPLPGVQSAQYVCQQGYQQSVAVTTVAAIEWAAVDGCPHTANASSGRDAYSSSPVADSDYWFFSSTDSAVPLSCIAGWYTNSSSSHRPVALYGRFDCSNQPAASSSSSSSSTARPSGASAGVIQALQVFAEPSCTQPFSADYSYLALPGLASSVVHSPPSSALPSLIDGSVEPPCVVHPVAGVASGRFACYSSLYRSEPLSLLLWSEWSEWQQSDALSCNGSGGPDVQYAFVDWAASADYCHRGAANISGTEYTVYATFDCSTNSGERLYGVMPRCWMLASWAVLVFLALPLSNIGGMLQNEGY